MIMDVERMRRLRRLAHVPRWVVAPTIKKQSVAEHSFHVTWIAICLAEQYNRRCDDPSKEVIIGWLMLRAITHDEGEAVSGDFPAPYKKVVLGKTPDAYSKERGHGLDIAKSWYGEASEVSQIMTAKILRVADLVEAFLFASEEQQLGNSTLITVMEDIYSKYDSEWSTIERLMGLTASQFLNRLVGNLHMSMHPCMLEILNVKRSGLAPEGDAAPRANGSSAA